MTIVYIMKNLLFLPLVIDKRTELEGRKIGWDVGMLEKTSLAFNGTHTDITLLTEIEQRTTKV